MATISTVYRHMIAGLLAFFASVGITLVINEPMPGLIGFIAFCLISIIGMDKYIKAIQTSREIEELEGTFN